MIALFLLPQPATAQAPGSPFGSYSGPAYSGGTYTDPNNSASNPRPPVKDGPVGDSGSQWGGGTGAAYGVYPGTIQSFSGSSACTGDIKTSFTWMPPASNPSAPPPPVIITETTSSGWSANDASATGDYSNPYHCPTTPSSTGYGISEKGTHYSTQPGAASIPLTVTLTASSSGTGSSSGVHYASDSVAYSAFATPVTITLGGTLTDGSGIPGNFTVTKYSWSGVGSAFKTYNEKATSNQLVPLGPGDLSGSSLAFYDGKQENLTVTCAITVNAPDGTSLSLTATAPQVDIVKPTLTNWDIAEGYVQFNPSTSNGAAYGLYGNLSGPIDASTNGMIWSNVMVSVPSPFSGNGQCTFTQLINPNRLGYNGNSSQPLVPNNGILGLDGSFEYGSPWNVTAVGSDVDSPNQPTSYAGYTELSASDAFTTYVMYQPSGGVWVPLEKISWMWSVTINRQSSTSPWSLTASYPASAGQAGTPTHVPISDPPQWTVVH